MAEESLARLWVKWAEAKIPPRADCVPAGSSVVPTMSLQVDEAIKFEQWKATGPAGLSILSGMMYSGFAFICLSISGFTWYHAIKFVKRSTSCDAVVARNDSFLLQGGLKFRPVYKITLPNGKKVEVAAPKLWRTPYECLLLNLIAVIGQKLRYRYDPTNPSSSKPDELLPIYGEAIAFSALGLAFAGVGLYYLLWLVPYYRNHVDQYTVLAGKLVRIGNKHA